MERRIGAVYLCYFLAAMAAEGMTSAGWRTSGLIVNLCAYVLYAAVVLGFYALFERVDRPLSLCAAVAGILGCLAGVLQATHLAPHNLNQLLFFAALDLLIGLLIVKSNVMPRIFGGLMIAAGIGWFVYLVPGTAIVAPYLAGLGIVAEIALMLRLLIARSNPATSTV